MSYFGRFILLLNLFTLFTSCAVNSDQVYSVHQYSTDDKIIKGVPFIRQKYKYCGPAAIATVMKYYGEEVEQDQIAKSVFTSELGGSLISDMRHYAELKGYNSYTKNSDLPELQSFIDNHKPAILLVDRGTWKVSIPHYYVVYGYNESNKTYIINDGMEEARKINYTELDSEWKKMNYMVLIISK